MWTKGRPAVATLMARLAGGALGLLLVVVGCAPAQPGTPRPTTAPPPTSALTSALTPAPAPAAGPRGLPAALRGTEWEHLPTARRVVALTFDA